MDDLRYAFRRLRAKPLDALTAIAMFAVAVGLTTAMFTLADTLLFRPVPFEDPDRLARLSMMGRTGGRLAVSRSVFREWQSSSAFDAVEAAEARTAVVDIDGALVTRGSALVSPGLFQMLDARPIRGRSFEPGDGRSGADDRVLISEDLWRTSFGSDPNVVGRRVRIDSELMTIVGVLPADFRFPSWDTAIWRAIDYAAEATGPLPVVYVRFAATMARADALRIGTDAARQVDAAVANLSARDQPLAGLILNPYYERAVPVLFAGVGFVFLVLCANVSALLLVRLTDRRREFSMCVALGASRRRLWQQALLEGALLGFTGSIVGIALAWLLVSVARGFLPEAFLLRSLNPLNLDWRALAAAGFAGALGTVIAGALPAWLATRFDVADSLRTGDRTGTDSRATRSLTRALVIAEVAMACTLLVGAVGLVRSFVNLASVDRGLDSSGVIVATIALPNAQFVDATARMTTRLAIESEMRQLPGVAHAAASFGQPPNGGGIHFIDDLRASNGRSPAGTLTVESYLVGSDFFELYRIPIVAGRSFRSGDGEHLVIVGERLAAIVWPDRSPVGETMSFDNELYEVVGVAREIHHPSIDARMDRPEFYRPLVSRSGNYFSVSLRCGSSCPDAALVRHRLISINPAIRVVHVGPLDAVYFEQLAAPRAAAALGFVFAATALVASAGGIFGALTSFVARRRREFGVRLALGASPPQIRRLVVRDSVVIACAGIGLGAIGGGWLGSALESLYYGASAADPVSWMFVIGVLALAALAPAWRPASQAARVDPALLLRDE